MDEVPLNAILHLFAIQAAAFADDRRPAALAIVDRYLHEHLRIAGHGTYHDLFGDFVDLHVGGDPAASLEQARRLAANLKCALPRFEQHVFMMYCLELARAGGPERVEIAGAVAAELTIAPQVLADFGLIAAAAAGEGAARLSDNFLQVNPGEESTACRCRHLERPDFFASFIVYRLEEGDAYFLVSSGHGQVVADSVPLPPRAPVLLQPGFILRDGRGARLYHAEIAAAFRAASAPTLFFRGEHLEYRFAGSDSGLHDFDFHETGGRLVGIMGVSGAGKSTLLNILNGQRAPDGGRITINGIDLYREAGPLEGAIGHVPQDDLLFEDLSVFDNLFFNASLCLSRLDARERAARVDALLDELHQSHTRNFKVGSPLDKIISGGERKRLNIALELIREPSILLVDEPTSGLSSVDSENVMALLKAQAAKGRLVIVVIHQPSSRLLKMFDALWILDKGGRPIYTGNPHDAILHFRSEAHLAGTDEYACPRCGNVNPEQIFEIVEAQAVDESGRFTGKRAVEPEEWHRRHLRQRAARDGRDPAAAAQGGKLDCRLWRPGLAGQFAVFFQRTFKGRLTNRQYLLINVLEPPLLALIAALVCRGAWGAPYVFMDNGNLSTYFSISVVVAIFLGMSVSAVEINRDRRVLSRERMLHLSWPSYVSAKTFYLALVVALQTALYTLVGNAILRVPDMFATMWAVLFFSALTSCVLGLNISASLKSAVNIYVLIPLLLVPQILLGGATVPFDELKSRRAGSREVPWVANIVPARWGYEALLVEQYVFNRYQRPLFADDCAVKQSDYLIHLHIPEMRALADYPFIETADPDRESESARRLAALANEVKLLEKRTGIASGLEAGLFASETYTPAARTRIKAYLQRAVQHYQGVREEAASRKSAAAAARQAASGAAAVQELRRTHYNTDVAAVALNSKSLETVRLSGERLVQFAAAICQEPESTAGLAHFPAAAKRLGARSVGTVLFNLGVLGAMTVVLFAALCARLLPRLLNLAESGSGAPSRREARRGRC